MWVLDSVEKRAHCASPGDFGRTFIRARAKETEEGLRVEEATGESLDGALSWLPGHVAAGKERAQVGLLSAPREGARETGRGLSLPWLQVSRGPVEFRRKRVKSSWPRKRMGVPTSASFILRVIISLLQEAGIFGEFRGGFQ